MAYVWLILLVPGLVAWTAFLIVHPDSISKSQIPDFYRFGETSVNLALKITDQNRPVGFGMIALTLSYLLTSTLTPNGTRSLYDWIGAMFDGYIAWLILLADNTWTLLLAWTALDLFQLVRYFRTQDREPEKLIANHISKFIGSMLLVYISARTYQANPVSFFGKPVENLGLMLLVSSFLHSGLLWRPIEKNNQNAIIFQFLSLAANLFVLTQVDTIGVAPIALLVSKIFLAILSILFAWNWSNGKDESEKLNDLLLAFASMAGYLFLASNQIGIVYLLVILLLVVSWIYIYTDRFPIFSIFWIMGLALATSLPFVPGNLIISQFLSEGKYFDLLASIIPISLVMTGILKFARMQKGIFNYRENLVKGVYTFGLALPIISTILIMTFMTPGTIFNTFSLIAAGSQILLLFIFQITTRQKITTKYLLSGNAWINARKSAITKIARQVTDFLLLLTRSLYNFFVNLFEGEGGILWSIVLLSLLIAILATQGAGA